MRKNFKGRQLFILFVDVLLMYASLLIALFLRRAELPTSESLREHLFHFSLNFAWWILVFYTVGLYRIDRRFDDFNFLKRLAAGLAVAGLSSVLYFYALPTHAIAPKTVLALQMSVFGILLWMWRYFYGNLWRNNSKQRVGVGFVGSTIEVGYIIDELRQHTPIGYDARFIFDSRERTSRDLKGIPVYDDFTALRGIVENTDSDLIVISQEQSLPASVLRELYGLLDMRVRFMRLPDFYEMILRRVPIDAINETWFLENIDLKAKRPYELLKSLIDRLLAAVLMLVSLPFWPFIALIIKLESPGPVFFKQKRVGRFGRQFVMVKFRSMRVEGNDFKPTGENDGRITHFGAFLRASRIDELPQFLNILRGEMSFVGPRPERPEIADELSSAIPYYQQRHLVKPGVTGWDQVSGEYHSPSIEDTQKKLQYDLYYLKNESFSLDFSIFFKTIMTVLQRKGR